VASGRHSLKMTPPCCHAAVCRNSRCSKAAEARCTRQCDPFQPPGGRRGHLRQQRGAISDSPQEASKARGGAFELSKRPALRL